VGVSGVLIPETPVRPTNATEADEKVEDENPPSAVRRLQQFFNRRSDDVAVQSYVTAEAYETTQGAVQGELNLIKSTLANIVGENQDVKSILVDISTTLKGMAKSEDLEILKKEIGDIKASNQEWMKDQMEKIDEAIKEAETKATKYYMDGLEELKKSTQKEIADLTAEEIKDAKEKLERFAKQTFEYEESVKAKNDECNGIISKLQEYEKKYNAMTKEYC
jgi:vacuolar-type H+-ATPase subunit H